ncbi:hypothetical protein [Vallitalea guaymasensis]|uniref:hypothetical protein n=1 Tax=Vallitalea guaymasensis TaxID=1185412 RepID=UPI0023540316|nr:hypothetical protein [Vallitalea guaymasensis]
MNSLIKIAFVLMVAGLMILLKISPVEIFNYLRSYRPKKSRVCIRQKVLNVTQKRN